ncbi:hypothetical protein Glove_15g7 [Diversispora epigaea]|uniref:Serine-threonine/tyrosine-protein kinase catalytic domain-containing protein n=1 Tax=Diversispora epigaea TaxID=1348612 RepID=A0A397JPU2_9GLOM|nr:hypothetical protein Glove_15g7 [Diversispora epigaea]
MESSSSNVDLLNNIAKGKREMAIPGTPHKYKEIYTGINLNNLLKSIIMFTFSIECWNHNGNLRPNIFQVVKNLSETIISDASVEFEAPRSQSQSYNATDVKLENSKIQNKELEIQPDPPFVDVMAERARKESDGFEIFNLAVNDTSSFNPLPLRKLYNINKEINKGSQIALNTIGYCYRFGLGVEKNDEKGFEVYLKCAENGNIIAQLNASACYRDGLGTTRDATKSFQWDIKSVLAGSGSVVTL